MFEEENEVYGSFDTDSVGKNSAVDGKKSRKSLDDYYEDAIEAIRKYRREKLAQKKPLPDTGCRSKTNVQTEKLSSNVKSGPKSTVDDFDDGIEAAKGYITNQQLRKAQFFDAHPRTGSNQRVAEKQYVNCEEDQKCNDFFEETKNRMETLAEKMSLPDTACTSKANVQAKKPSSDLKKGPKSTVDDFDDGIEAAKGYITNTHYKDTFIETVRKQFPGKIKETKMLPDTACTSKTVSNDHFNKGIEESKRRTQQYQQEALLNSFADDLFYNITEHVPGGQPRTSVMTGQQHSFRNPLTPMTEEAGFRIPLFAAARASDKLEDAFVTDFKNEISLEAEASSFMVTGLALQFKTEPMSELKIVFSYETSLHQLQRTICEETGKLDQARRTVIHLKRPLKVNPHQKARIRIEIDDVNPRDCFLTLGDRKNWRSRDFKIGVNSNKMDAQQHLVFCISEIFYTRDNSIEIQESL